MTQEMQNGERLVPFMGVKILLAGSVLAPRAETELLGNAALALLGGMEGAGLLAIDMCCGSGNLCCGLASAAPQVTFLGADLTDDAVAAARLNVERLGLGERVLIRQGDLFAALDGEAAEGRADLIVKRVNTSAKLRFFKTADISQAIVGPDDRGRIARLHQDQIHQQSRRASVAIHKRMDGHKAVMRTRRDQRRMFFSLRGKPRGKIAHQCRNLCRIGQDNG